MSDSSFPNVRMHLNEEHGGIELAFDKKPDDHVIQTLKENGFRWHRKEHLWFAKNTQARLAFAQKIAGLNAKDIESEKPLQPSFQKASGARATNTFAAFYDSIGDAKILSCAEGKLSSFQEAFFEEEQLYFRRTYGGDTITLLNLKNAQKIGETCEEWRVSAGYFEKASLLTLLERAGVNDIPQLLSLCRSGKVPDGLSIYKQEYKGANVFSPFVEVKPLKSLPEKWTKRNFTQALMNGQLYRGEVDYRYTDDYAYDAAVGFRSGVGLNMPSFVKNAVGDWSSCTTCYTSKDARDKYGASPIHYSEHSNSSKTLWFDVNCDIAEGKRRADVRAERILQHNSKLEASCIQLLPEQIDPEKCYTLQTLDTHTNTGLHQIKEEVLQGHALRDRLGPDGYCPYILKAEALPIEQDRFYVIADFFHRRDHAPDDPRVISCGNWKQIVTGKALLELTAEGTCVPVIHTDDREYSTYECARAQLMSQATGRSRFLGSKPDNFVLSLARLNNEFKRAGLRRLEDMIQDATVTKPSSIPERSSPERER